MPPSDISLQGGNIINDSTVWIEAGKATEFTCTVPKIKPAVSIVWKANGGNLTEQPKTEDHFQSDKSYKLTSVYIAKFNRDVQANKIECYVGSPSKSASQTVEVYCKYCYEQCYSKKL